MEPACLQCQRKRRQIQLHLNFFPIWTMSIMSYFNLKCWRIANNSLLFICLHGFILLAEAEESPPSEQAYLQDFPVVLSASRLSQLLSEAPNAMTVIDREMIVASGFRTIADLFRLVPGMYVGYRNGHAPIVGYHGTTEDFSRRMQVLIDGRSVYLPPFSSVDWEDIPLNMDDIERIEVVRGPAAASFGANSLQGVINIITRDAGSETGNRLSFLKGAEGEGDITAHMGKAGELVDYRMTFAHRQDNGFGSVALNDAKRTNQFNLRTNFHPVGTDSFDFQLGFSDSIQGLGIAGKTDDVFRNTISDSGFQQFGWLHTMQNGDDVKLNYYHINRNYLDEKYYSYNQGKIFSPASTIVERHDLELQQTLQLAKNNRMVWGVGARSDYADSKEYLVTSYTLNQSRFFAHDEWRVFSPFLINVGAMIEDDGLGHTNTSPRLALNYHVTQNNTLRAGTSVAYRNPSMFEESAKVNGAYVSKGGLSPEKIVSQEIGYLGEFRTIGASLDLRAYNDQISDVIFVDPSLTYFPFSFANLYSAHYYGYEGTLKFHWSDSGNVIWNFSQQNVSCEATGTPTRADMIPVLQGYLNQCHLTVPEYSGSVLLSQKLSQNLQVSAGYYYQSMLKWLGEAYQPSPQSPMNRVDLRIARAFGKTGQAGSGELALVIQNALQDNYTNYSGTSETRNVLFKQRALITASFNF
jgi:iron complex outermembrane recepter protein